MTDPDTPVKMPAVTATPNGPDGPTPLDLAALEAARLAIENELVEMRDARIFIMPAGNGFVIRERDGSESSVIRLRTVDGLRIGISAYLAALEERA